MHVTGEVVERLSRYRSVLLRLRSLGFVRVFSDNLSDAVGISASQVRKDLAAFGMKGIRRGGYPIESLLHQLNTLLGATNPLKAVVVGCGNIGTALLSTYGRRHGGVKVVAGFDVRAEILAPEAEIPVLDMRELDSFVRREAIQVAILSVPEQSAAQVLEQLCEAGIRGVLNFTAAQLRGGATCLVRSINIGMELEKLFYMVHFSQSDSLDSERCQGS